MNIYVNGRRFFLMEYKKVRAKVFLNVIGDRREIPYWRRNVRHECSDLYHIPVQVLISSIKVEVKKKHFSFGWNFSCFAAHLIERELF
jgi:hypothetical protein